MTVEMAAKKSVSATTGGMKKRKKSHIYRVQASDGHFFEKITAAMDVDEPVDDELYTIKNLTISAEQRKLMEALYIEALYTIHHKIGKENSDSKESLCKYVKAAFQGDNQLHNQLIERAKQVKPPVVLLNVLLLEARDLVAKDVNGFSDPFAMMGVVPGKRTSPQTLGPGADTENASPGPQTPEDSHLHHLSSFDGKQKDGVLQRFGGSFRRKPKKDKIRGPLDEGQGIPAKLIKASSVQNKTLNPKWNEKFQFIVDDSTTDRFHIDIWDHDDEEQSVLDAVSTLNQISGGLKGLGRYFKEVTQSARADSDDSTDDFLGCINLDLDKIPPEGIEQWVKLEPRSDRSKVSGTVRLKMWLSTREDRIGDEEDMLDVKEHIELSRQFALYEIRQSGSPVRMWDGYFPDKPTCILRQHAIQGDLDDVQVWMCKWLAFHSMIPIDISFTLLHQTLHTLLEKWKPMALEKEEENLLLESFHHFDAHCKKVLLEHRERFAPAKRNSGEEFSSLIKCMKSLRESTFFSKFLTAKRPFVAHIESLLAKSADVWFAHSVEQAQDDDPCKELLSILTRMNSACSKFLHFSAAIREIARADYAHITLSTFDTLLCEYLTSELMSEKKTDLKSQLRLAAADPPSDDDLIDLLRIHISFVELRNHRLANRVRVRDEPEWSDIFNRGIKKFLDVARDKALARVALACQLDMPITAGANDMKQSSSHVDICHIIEQMTVGWERCEITDAQLRAELTERFVDLLCEVVKTYAFKTIQQLEAEGFQGELQVFLPSALLSIFCSAINNCEHVRRALMVHEKLRLEDLGPKDERDQKGGSKWRQLIERRLEECDEAICSEIDRMIEMLIKRLLPQMKKHVFHLAWSPAACAVEDSLKPLTDMLDIELSAVHRQLLHKNFLRVLSIQAVSVVKLLKDCVDENSGMEPQFYQRLFDAWGVLVDFFHAGGKGISMEQLDTTPRHVDLVKCLSLNQTPTDQLIEKYYKELLKQQNEVTDCKYGILNLRAYYNAKSQTLVLDVIGAKQVIPLDTNGLSDPFVVIELVPKARFSSQPVLKTKVVPKTLNPIFDETFEFHIPQKASACALIHFTVMDHDYLRSNDFAGEAYLELADVPGFLPGGASTLRQFNLVLIHPVNNCTDVFEVLGNRKEDKEAQDFLRNVQITY
ncbi:unnamed protein product, partial [Mesorhabditis belari]|uniref:Uncharacterized protein n=1 Tax=Mesorhabditis belari TaxID=2138241 RepID=A0AAF3EGX8_9BILA